MEILTTFYGKYSVIAEQGDRDKAGLYCFHRNSIKSSIHFYNLKNAQKKLIVQLQNTLASTVMLNYRVFPPESSLVSALGYNLSPNVSV